MFLEVPEFNKYLYYFMCLVADTAHLIWIAYCMFNSKLIRNISIFSIIYLALTIGLIIGYFYLGDRFPESLGLSGGNIAKWSRYDLISIFSGVGVFMAPIAVLIGFNAWKKQQFETSKIRVIEDIKSILAKQNDSLKNYRLGKSVSLINNNEIENFKKLEKDWINEFENFRSQISCILQKDSFYFVLGSVEHLKLYDLNNKTFEIMDNLEAASADIISFKSSQKLLNLKDGEVETNQETLNKRMYLLQPMYIGLPFNYDKKQIDLKNICIEFEIDQIYKYLDDFFDYLNTLLKEAYKQ